MKYVGLIFHGTLQSWGDAARIDSNADSPKSTEFFPTKSAILGFLRGALGEPRSNRDEDGLRNARILIRADRQGSLGRDYQVAQRTHHGFKAGNTKVIPKFFLQDATFIVLVGHPSDQVIHRLEQAVQSPQWAPFLGRRAHVPTLPPLLGVIDTEDPRHFLGADLPIFWGSNDNVYSKRVLTYDSQLDEPWRNPTLDEVMDEPVSLHPRDRLYANRTVQIYGTIYEIDQKPEPSIRQYGRLREAFDRKAQIA